jgi:hypothetical protein
MSRFVYFNLIVGLFMMFGSVGGLEQNTMGFGQAAFFGLIGSVLALDSALRINAAEDM